MFPTQLISKLSALDFDALGAKFENSFEKSYHAMSCVYGEAKLTREAQERMVRIFEFEYGTPPTADTTGRFAPRSLAQMPLMYEPDDLEKAPTTPVTLNVEEDNAGRIPSRGYVANIGDDPFRVVFHGVNGNRQLTMMPGTTLAVTWLTTLLEVVPIKAAPAVYQVVLQ